MCRRVSVAVGGEWGGVLFSARVYHGCAVVLLEALALSERLKRIMTTEVPKKEENLAEAIDKWEE